MSANTTVSARLCSACNTAIEAFADYGLSPPPGRCPKCGAKPQHRSILRYLKRSVRPQLTSQAHMLEVGAAKFATRHHVRDDVISADLSPSEHLRYELKQSFELVIAFKSEAGERRFPAP